MTPKTKALIPPGHLVRSAWGIVHAHWREYARLVGWYIVPLIIVHAIGQLIYFGGYTLVLTVAFYVFFGLLALLIQTCVIRAMQKYSKGEELGRTIDHLKTTLQYIPAALGIVIIVGSVSFIAIAVISLPMIVMTVFSLQVPLASVITFLLILAVLLLLSVYFLFPLYVLIDEHNSIIASIRKSIILVHGNWLALFARSLWLVIVGLAVAVLVLYAVVLIIGLLIGAPGEGFREAAETIWWVELAQLVVTMLIAPYFVSGTWILYQDVKKTYES